MNFDKPMQRYFFSIKLKNVVGFADYSGEQQQHLRRTRQPEFTTIESR